MLNKIYTRHKFRIPKFQIISNNKRSNKKRRKTIKIFIILLIAILTFKFTMDGISPIFNTICEDKAKALATIISNDKATEVMNNYTYEQLYSVEKDKDGNITMIKSNIISVNEITSSIAQKIQQEINNKGKDSIGIALGSFTGIKFFSGKGPKIKIAISPIGNVETELKSEFTAQGINQTLHRIYLQEKCEVSILTPFNNITQNITNQILLAENVIVGNIPQTYYNLEGMSKDDVMEPMN